jgi:DNA-binding NarL/FixJ family response regulator
MTIRVVLADDQALIRAGFRSIVERDPDLRVVGEAATGAEAVAAALALRPHVVVMDIRMPVLDGIAATARICGDPALAGTRVVVVSTYEFDEYVFGALRAGASGFLLKDLEPDDLREGIRLVAAGEALLGPSVTRRVIAEFARTRPRSAAQQSMLDRLTGREREVVGLVAQGLSNDDIAARLVISPTTAKTHVSRAMTKLDCRDRAQLVVFAYETGIVIPAGP